MSDGMTDKRSQPEFATPYIHRTTLEVAISEARTRFNNQLLQDDQMYKALKHLTLEEFNRLGAAVEKAMEASLHQHLRIK